MTETEFGHQDLEDQQAHDATGRAGLEAVLMVADRPLTEEEIAHLLGLGQAVVSQLLHGLVMDYNGEAGQPRRGFELRRVGGGWRIGARPEHRDAVSRFVLDGQTTRLSSAAMETLAIIAYQQPVSRARIAGIRGVNADGVIRTLITRGLIEQTSTDESTGAALFGTTRVLLERLGLDSLDELPELSPLLPGVENLEDVLSMP